MAKLLLTNTSVAAAKAKAKPGATQEDFSDTREPNLNLRVGARGARWQLRFTMAGKATRLDFGDVDQWSLAEARAVAAEATSLIRGGIRRPDADWVFEQLVKHGKIDAPETPQQDPRLSLKWSWEDAKREYLLNVERTRKPRTHEDYTGMLRTPELDRFAGRPVASITLKEMTLCVGDVFKRGVERHAEHLASVIRPMWKFLARLDQQDNSGVIDKRFMAELEAPPRTRSTVRRKKKYAPPLHEMGRMLVIARSGVFHPTVGAAMELMLFTAQRPNAVATAHMEDFSHVNGNLSRGLWSMPPAHRKTAEKRGDEGDHIIPLPASAYNACRRMFDLNDDEVKNPYLFRGLRPRRKGAKITSIASSNLQHGLMYSPGITMRPHDIRRAFTTLGAEHFQWSLEDAKSILDHNEGRRSNDVTVINYLWNGNHQKWVMMNQWCELLEKAAVEALAWDDRLADLDWLKRVVVRERTAHKTGYRAPISLAKPPKEVEPVPQGPIDLDDVA